MSHTCSHVEHARSPQRRGRWRASQGSMGPEEAPRQGELLREAGRAAGGGGEAEEAFLANPVKGAVLGEDRGEVLTKQKKREIFKR